MGNELTNSRVHVAHYSIVLDEYLLHTMRVSDQKLSYNVTLK